MHETTAIHTYTPVTLTIAVRRSHTATYEFIRKMENFDNKTFHFILSITHSTAPKPNFLAITI